MTPNAPLQTLARPVAITGIGLHGGQPVRVALRPLATGGGIVFRRLDLERRLEAEGRPARVEVVASIEHVCLVDHATTLGADTPAGRATIGTVEHLLAALAGLGVDSCVVELDAAEVPILDGSSAPWVELIQKAGLRPLDRARRVRRLVSPITVEAGAASIVAYPSDELRLTCAIDFSHPVIGRQERSLTLTPGGFVKNLAPARTFGFLREVEALQAKGLVKGGSLDNAVVLDEERVVSGDLRFADEFVRHKMLDLLGDLALAGMPLHAHVVARRAGHALHVQFLRELLANPRAWVIETAGPAAEPRVGSVLPATLGPASLSSLAQLK